MATVTVIVTLRRTAGRTRPDPDDLAAQVLAELETSIGTELDVAPLHSDDELTYEVTGIRAARADEPGPVTVEEANCNRCGTPISNDPHGAPRRYCGDACRQAAYRERKQQQQQHR